MATPTWTAAGTQVQGTTGTLSPPWPASHAVDDIALLCVQTQGGVVATLTTDAGFVPVTDPVAFPNGYVEINTGAGSVRISLFWCRATSTTMATPDVTPGSDHAIARIGGIRGCINTGNPWDIIVQSSNDTAGTAASATGGTTTLDAELIVILFGNAIDSAASQVSAQANADLASLTERFDSNASQGSGGGVCFNTGTKVTAGAFAATTATFAASTRQANIVIAMRSLAFPTVTSSYSFRLMQETME